MLTGRGWWFLVVVFTVLTAVMTYPQVLHMTDGVHDPGDPLMVTWVLGWVAHQLPRAPAHIFDANIFFPERNTLAYSETSSGLWVKLTDITFKRSSVSRVNFSTVDATTISALN